MTTQSEAVKIWKARKGAEDCRDAQMGGFSELEESALSVDNKGQLHLNSLMVCHSYDRSYTEQGSKMQRRTKKPRKRENAYNTFSLASDTGDSVEERICI
jgi:hypothetical protein